MLVPADLPFFLNIALEVCATQKPEHLVETLVIPDQLIPGFSEVLETYAKNYSISPIRLVQPPLHFNYVTGTYRLFQKSKGSYEDNSLRLLLVRLLIDAYDRSEWVYEIPSINDLAKGITDKSNRITYVQEQTRQRYSEFRPKLQELIECGILGDERASIIQDEVRPFDKAFG